LFHFMANEISREQPRAHLKVTSESRTLRRDELSQRVLSAALGLFAERGYHGTSVPMILEAAGVSASSLYRLFPSKEALVNAVFLDAKGRLGAALAEVGELAPRDAEAASTHARFARIWDRLARFAEDEPVAFRFLELQDHTPYLDGTSRAKELSVLAPLALACVELQARGELRADTSVDVMLATLWGALVGLVKAARLGYVRLDAAKLAAARDALWRGFSAGVYETTPRERTVRARGEGRGAKVARDPGGRRAPAGARTRGGEP
jgi:AcrR family transcriptional regulator